MSATIFPTGWPFEKTAYEYIGIRIGLEVIMCISVLRTDIKSRCYQETKIRIWHINLSVTENQEYLVDYNEAALDQVRNVSLI